jgi:hypothetical protein
MDHAVRINMFNPALYRDLGTTGESKLEGPRIQRDLRDFVSDKEL